MAGFYRLELEDDIPPFLWTDKMLSNSKICIVLQRISQLIFDLIADFQNRIQSYIFLNLNEINQLLNLKWN